mgnify:CR=1 FL=1
MIAICSLYYALDKRLSLTEQKLDYMIARYDEKEVDAKLELLALKESDKEINKDLHDLQTRILKICAVLPKSIKIEDEN